MRIFAKYAITYAIACSHITGIPIYLRKSEVTDIVLFCCNNQLSLNCRGRKYVQRMLEMLAP